MYICIYRLHQTYKLTVHLSKVKFSNKISLPWFSVVYSGSARPRKQLTCFLCFFPNFPKFSSSCPKFKIQVTVSYQALRIRCIRLWGPRQEREEERERVNALTPLRGRPVDTWGRGMVFFWKNCLFRKVTKKKKIVCLVPRNKKKFVSDNLR